MKERFRIRGGGQLYTSTHRQSALSKAQFLAAAYGCRFWVNEETRGTIYCAIPMKAMR